MQRASAVSGLSVLLLIQFALLLYNPKEQIPTSDDRIAGDHILKLIADTPGEVFMPFHNFLPVLAGKKPYAHQAGIDGIHFDPARAKGKSMMQEIGDAIRRKEFGLVIVDKKRYAIKDLSQHYKPIPFNYPDKDTFYPLTGMVDTRPMIFYVPK